jgi:hypothetical protein
VENIKLKIGVEGIRMRNSKNTILCDFCKKRKAVVVYYNEVKYSKSYIPRLNSKTLCRVCDYNAYKFLKGSKKFN